MEKKAPNNLDTEEEVSIWLDEYDDVFSDFDSRSFNHRVLSDDFLNEIKKMVQEMPAQIDVALKFQLMNTQRDEQNEAVIIRSIRNHFRHQAEKIKEEIMETNRKGYFFSVFGFLIICIPVLMSKFESFSAFSNIHVMLEPVGWFLTWSGLDNLFQNSRKAKSSLNFNSRMAEAIIIFSSYETDENSEMIMVHSSISQAGNQIKSETKMIPLSQELKLAM